MPKGMKGEQRQRETAAGMNTTASSKTNNNDPKDKTTSFDQDKGEKKQPLLDQNNSRPFGQVDPPQNSSSQFSNDCSQFSNDSNSQFSSRCSSAISSSLSSCKEVVRRGVDWDQEVDIVFMEEIDKMSRQME